MLSSPANHRVPTWPAVILSIAVASLCGLSSVARAATRFVPASIDATGRTDVTSELEHFVGSTPNNATIVFPRRARYRIDGTLQWRDRTGITVDGNRATLIAGTHGGPNRATVRLLDGSDWTIRDLNIKGSEPVGESFNPRYQWQHGFDLRGVNGAVLRNVTVSGVFGDDIYVGLSTTSARWSQDIEILNSTGVRSGRMSIAITAGRRVTVSGGRWSDPGLDNFDIEPNGRPGGADQILIENSEIVAGSHAAVLTIAGRGPVSNVTLRNNTVIGRPLTVQVDQGPDRPRNITIKDNISAATFAGPGPAALVFRNTDGVTVRGNVQPLMAGTDLVATQGATRVKVSGSYLKVTGRNWVPYGIAAVAATILLMIGLRWRDKRRGASGEQLSR